MDLIKVAVLAVSALVVINILQQYNKTYAVIASASATVLIVLYAIKALSPVIQYFQSLTQFTDTADFSCVIKAIGLGLIAQTAADLCTESGQLALANKVILVGKAAVIIVTLPLFETLLQILQNLMK